jgi:hypothetical protein
MVAEDTQEESWLDILRAMTDAELGVFALDTDTKLRMYRDLAGYAAGELLRRRPEGARLAAMGDVLVTYSTGYRPYLYDIEALRRVFKPLLTASQWAEVLTEETIPEQVIETVNTASATAVARKLGTMALQAFESCRTRVEKEPRLTFERIKGEDDD